MKENDIVMCQVPANMPFAPTTRPDCQWLRKSFLKDKIYTGGGGGGVQEEVSQKIEEG